ncbi:si:ch211-226m16.3 protein isoform X5 [Danio rerio]|uniref:Si:ch211-226m16.3 protein isoform X5 n=1 Tax=Danio rerio TaxID=7955 RepID=A0AC58IJP8_DANRE
MLASVLGFFLLLFLSPSLADDTVAEDIGPHQLERLVELLTVRECEDLIFALSQPEESIFKHLDRLSAERNQLFPSRRRRSTNHQPPCHSALKDWLQIHGEQIYYDRLSRALQQIGRTDIAIAKAFTWKDVDLVVIRQPAPPYQHHLLDRAWPLIFGLLLGFVGALLMSVPILLISIYVSHGNSTKSKAKHQPRLCPLLSVVTSSQIRCQEDTE